MKVCFHIIEHKVEIFVILRLDNIEQPDDILMAIKFLKEHHFTECALCISCVMKSIEHFLKSYNLEI
jgi:hypothetical protein